MIGGKKSGSRKTSVSADTRVLSEVVREGSGLIPQIIALALTLLLTIGLPIAYLVYLKRLEDQKCVCATSHELFQRLRVVVVLQLAFTILLPLISILPPSFSMALSLVMTIVMGTTFLVWFRDMATLKCMCTRGWEKNVWLVMSMIDVTFFLLYVIAAVMAGSIRGEK